MQILDSIFCLHILKMHNIERKKKMFEFLLLSFQKNLPLIAFQLKLFQELCMIGQMFTDKRRNEEVGVIISFSKFVQKWHLSFCGSFSEVVGQQLVLFQELIFATLIDENFQRRTIVGGNKLSCIVCLPR